jgi:small subunit ribosomal protein S20
LKSGIKRHKQSLKRRIRNRHVRSTVKTAIKDVRTAIAENNVETATGALAAASSELARAAKKGVLHRKTASRRVGRLAKALHKASSEK